LEELQCGVLCLTPENISASWVLFEAGALSKAVSVSRVIPYLLGFEPRELQGPLAQFQAVRADEAGTFRLLNAINIAGGNPFLSQEALSEAFQVWWPRLAPDIKALVESQPAQVPAPQRSLESMVGEVLELMRAQRLAVSEPVLQQLLEKKTLSGERLGTIIKQLRRQRNWSQYETAYRLGISQTHLSRVENGNSMPSIELLSAISAVFGLSVSDLMRLWIDEVNNPGGIGSEPMA
jgi:DNA-binding XRE family transcriptional regulator